MKRVKLIILMLAFFLFACAPTEEAEETPVLIEDEQTEDAVDQTSDSDGFAEERLAQFYIDLMESGHYTLVYRGYWDEDGTEEEVLFTMSYLDEKTAMQIEDATGSIVGTTILAEDEMHIVSHEEETVITMPLNQIEDTMDELQDMEDLEMHQLEFIGEGTGTFMGEMRYYEEYNDGTTHIFYYFDGETLDGMEFISNGDRTIFDLESMSPEVDETLFEIPEHYEQIGLNF